MSYAVLLDGVIEKALLRLTSEVEGFALLFSGGLDSSLLAKVCLDLGRKPALLSVYMEDSRDEAWVRRAASFLNLELMERPVSMEDVARYVDIVPQLASITTLPELGIAVSLYAGFEAAACSGFKAVMVGQGADELFAGYHRYLRMERQVLQRELKNDIENIAIARDASLASSLGLRLLAPYLDAEVIKLALSIPVDLKVRGGVRKFILREVARRRGLPEDIWSREKKAIQYSTGVMKVVKRLAAQKTLKKEEVPNTFIGDEESV